MEGNGWALRDLGGRNQEADQWEGLIADGSMRVGLQCDMDAERLAPFGQASQ